MKFHIALRLAGICGAFTAVATAQSDRPAPPSAPAKETSGASARPPLTFDEAQRLLAAARTYVAHPAGAGTPGKVTEPEAVPEVYPMATPPPAPRKESKPLAPALDLVWVEGHYMPVEKEWRWVTGAWAKPATPISVWIPARYNEEVSKWFPGYWEPDRHPMPSADSPAPASASPSGAATPAAPSHPAPALPGN